MYNNGDEKGELSSSDEWQFIEPEEGDYNERQEVNSDDCLKRSDCNKVSTISIMDNKFSNKKEEVKMPSNNNNNNSNYNNNNNVDDNNYYTNGSVSRKRKYIELDPLCDRRQCMAPALIKLCTTLYSLVPFASLCAFMTLIILLTTNFWYITIIYFTYIFLDRQTCNFGGRRWDAFYKSEFWSHLAAYFPIKLRYSTEFKLNPRENYILNYHPHGIAAFGCVTTFATNGLNFSQLFPGIRSRFMVHEKSFCVPIMREIFSLRGDCSVNSKSIDYILKKKYGTESKDDPEATGNLLALCGGGLAEADLSNDEILKLVVANRKGFVKKALIHGAHLIPCIAFGENSVFKKIDWKPNSLMHKLETHWYRMMKFKHPIYYGCSIIGGEKLPGAMPYKRPITVCMGDPIHVERVAEPTQEQLDELHALYIQNLKQLYNANSDLCYKFDQKLELV